MKSEGEDDFSHVQFPFCGWEATLVCALLNYCYESNLPPPQCFLVFQNSVLLHLRHNEQLKMKIRLVFLCDNNLVIKTKLKKKNLTIVVSFVTCPSRIRTHLCVHWVCVFKLLQCIAFLSKILQVFPSFLLEVWMDFRKTKHKHCIAAGIALHIVDFFQNTLLESES